MLYDFLLNYNIFHWKVNDNSRLACIDVFAFIYNDFKRKGDLPAKCNDLITKSWAVSGSREKMALRIKEYILVYLSG